MRFKFIGCHFVFPDFVLIGGFAASAYGSTYVTHDLDVYAVLTLGNIEKLRKILEDLHPQHRMMIPKKSFIEIPLFVKNF